jgi:hypothetical protein
MCMSDVILLMLCGSLFLLELVVMSCHMWKTSYHENLFFSVHESLFLSVNIICEAICV